MKPAPFEYRRAETVEEALHHLREFGEDAKLLAGGQSLVPLLNFRLARSTCLVDVNPLTSLSYVRRNGGLRVGALTRHRTLEDDPAARGFPLLAEAVPLIGHPAIRNRGTVGGSLCHADPSAELPVAAVALGATLRAAGPDGDRTIPAGAFFKDYFETALGPGEILTEVSFPVPGPEWGWSFLEMSRRYGDFAVVCVAAGLALDGDGGCADARLVVGGVGPAPLRLTEAEEALRGHPPSAPRLAEAAKIAAGTVRPASDVHASAEFRRHLAGVLTERALAAARGGGR
ncbi:MAG: FAD binding domain-containing protein [Nitrospinota bacterium]